MLKIIEKHYKKALEEIKAKGTALVWWKEVAYAFAEYQEYEVKRVNGWENVFVIRKVE